MQSLNLSSPLPPLSRSPAFPSQGEAGVLKTEVGSGVKSSSLIILLCGCGGKLCKEQWCGDDLARPQLLRQRDLLNAAGIFSLCLPCRMRRMSEGGAETGRNSLCGGNDSEVCLYHLKVDRIPGHLNKLSESLFHNLSNWKINIIYLTLR